MTIGKTNWQTVAEKKAMYEQVANWHNDQFAYFLDRLKSLSTPEGTLLENSLILYGSSLGDGHEHDDELPIIFAGQGGGLVKLASLFENTKKNHDLNEWHLTALRALGIRRDKFGTARNTLSGYSKI